MFASLLQANLEAKEVAMLRTLCDIDDGGSWRRNGRREVSNACSGV